MKIALWELFLAFTLLFFAFERVTNIEVAYMHVITGFLAGITAFLLLWRLR